MSDRAFHKWKEGASATESTACLASVSVRRDSRHERDRNRWRKAEAPGTEREAARPAMSGLATTRWFPSCEFAGGERIPGRRIQP